MSNIKDVRKAMGLTQKQLADLVGTSQQQIQRIEAGTSLPSMKLAYLLVSALNEPLEKLFPAQFKAAMKVAKRTERDNSYDDDDLEEAADGGFELDDRIWHFKAFVTGRSAPLIIQVDPREQRRVFRELLKHELEKKNDFIAVYGQVEVVLLNKKLIEHAEFLHDRNYSGWMPEPTDNRPGKCNAHDLVIEFTSGSTRAISIGSQLIASPEGQEQDSTLKNVVHDLVHGLVDQCERIILTDDDGEDCVLRPASMSVVHVPYGAVFYQEDPEDYEDTLETGYEPARDAEVQI